MVKWKKFWSFLSSKEPVGNEVGSVSLILAGVLSVFFLMGFTAWTTLGHFRRAVELQFELDRKVGLATLEMKRILTRLEVTPSVRQQQVAIREWEELRQKWPELPPLLPLPRVFRIGLHKGSRSAASRLEKQAEGWKASWDGFEQSITQ